jgi:hypothetical protein
MAYGPPERALELARQRQEQMIEEAQRDRLARAVGPGMAGSLGRSLARLVQRLIPGARRQRPRGRWATHCASPEAAGRRSAL